MKKINARGWSIRVFALAFVIVPLIGCVSSSVQRYSPVFDYSPVKDKRPGAANVTFAVVGANYPKLISVFEEFGRNMSDDFVEILNARGYTVRGPFHTYDDMTFPDKKGSDLALIPEIELSGDASGLRWDQSFGAALFGQAGFTGSGSLVIRGRVNLVVAESLSREKMWTKSVDIPPMTVNIDETRMYGSAGVPADVLLQNEPSIYNDVAKTLEAQYKAILDRAYQYLDPEEMLIVKKQATEIRNKKVY